MWMDTSDESEFLSQVCIPTFFRSHRMSRVSDFPIHKAGQGRLGCLPVGPPKSRRSDMCQHLQHVKDMTFKRRLRISGVLCSLGIFFVAGLRHNFQIEKKWNRIFDMFWIVSQDLPLQKEMFLCDLRWTKGDEWRRSCGWHHELCKCSYWSLNSRRMLQTMPVFWAHVYSYVHRLCIGWLSFEFLIFQLLLRWYDSKFCNFIFALWPRLLCFGTLAHGPESGPSCSERILW